MQTTAKLICGPAQSMAGIADESVDLIVTSPPYPMVEMWDEIFALQDEEGRIGEQLSCGNGQAAFALMHELLDAVWLECNRVMKPGAIACINIGDATRTLDGDFQLYSNHSRILSSFLGQGFAALPDILWRKQTNAPNKFMGSGMLPVGAYVTYEHEYILVLAKRAAANIHNGRGESQAPRERLLLGGAQRLVFGRVARCKGNFARAGRCADPRAQRGLSV